MYQQNMQGMISNGAFGTSSPMVQQGFNPYQSNIIPFGNYNQPMIQQEQQYQYYNNSYGAQPQNNGLVFQPINGYQQSYQNYNNSFSQQQQNNYYNPYGNTFSQPSYSESQGYMPYGNSYSYNNYNRYVPYMSPAAIQEFQNQQVKMFKLKYRLANYYVGNEIDEEYLDRICNPSNPIYKKSEEQIAIDDYNRSMQEMSGVASGKIQVPRPYVYRLADTLNEMSNNMHKALDRHSLCQFLEEDLWRIQREEWIRKNIKMNGDRNLAATYNSKDYNELLKLHNSSSNPQMFDLLNNSRYDNNRDDIEMGMNIAFNKERWKKRLESKVPENISSDEVQQRRNQFTQALLNQIYRKGSVT